MRTSVFLTILLAFVANVSGFDPGSIEIYPTWTGNTRSIAKTEQGEIWVAMSSGVSVCEFNSKTDPAQNEVGTIFFGNDLRHIDIEGDYAYAAGAEGFIKYNIPDSTSEEITLLPSSNTFHVAAHGDEVWVATYKGLAKLGSNEVYQSSMGAMKVVRANDGAIFFNTHQYIARLKDSLTVWDWTSMLGNPVTIAADPNGGVWARTGGALWRFSSGRWREVYKYDGKTPKILWEMTIDHYGVMWGLSQGYLCRYDIGKDSMATYELTGALEWIECTDTRRSALGLDNQGRLLIGGNQKVAYVTDNESPVITPLRVSSDPARRSFTLSESGFILNKSARVSLQVFTASGRVLHDASGFYEAGRHELPFFRSSGCRVLRLSINGKRRLAKTLVLR